MRLYSDNCCLQRPLGDQTNLASKWNLKQFSVFWLPSRLAIIAGGSKMSISIQPMPELSHRARHALIQELGGVDAMRFFSQLSVCTGDYTAERGHLLKCESVSSLAANIKARRAGDV